MCRYTVKHTASLTSKVPEWTSTQTAWVFQWPYHHPSHAHTHNTCPPTCIIYTYPHPHMMHAHTNIHISHTHTHTLDHWPVRCPNKSVSFLMSLFVLGWYPKVRCKKTTTVYKSRSESRHKIQKSMQVALSISVTDEATAVRKGTEFMQTLPLIMEKSNLDTGSHTPIQ